MTRRCELLAYLWLLPLLAAALQGSRIAVFGVFAWWLLFGHHRPAGANTRVVYKEGTSSDAYSHSSSLRSRFPERPSQHRNG